jgi:4-amino-4-deoxy-L-arabinose transferase-like glycosyltransferase
MVMDGTLYACIARNLAEGIGSFWQLHFSDTLFSVFHEHPPLAIAMESLFFKFFGDSIFVERFYSFITLLVTTGLIVLIWKELTGNFRTGWMPLVLYFSVRKVTWAFANNMLENTMVIFTCLSVLFYLKSLRKQSVLFLMLSGLAVFLAFLSKGFTSLFVISLPFFIAISA